MAQETPPKGVVFVGNDLNSGEAEQLAESGFVVERVESVNAGIAPDARGTGPPNTSAETPREREQHLRLFIDQAPVALAMFDTEMRYLAASNRWAEDYGLAKAGLIGRSHYEVFPEITEDLKKVHRRCMCGAVERADAERFERADGSAQWLRWEVRPWRLTDETIGGIVIFSEDITERKLIENTQLFLLRSGHPESDQGFFLSLARYLAETLTMDFVCIDLLSGDHLSAKTLAVYYDGKFEDNIEYTLKDTPCGDVVGNTVCTFASGVRLLFPHDQVLQDMAAEGYVGTTLWSSDGRAIGLIALISRKPIENPGLAESLLKLVAFRAAGELEREQAEEGLRRENREVRLANRILQVFTEESDDTVFDRALAIVQEGMTSKHGVFGYISEPGHLTCPSLSKMLDECEIEGKCIHYPREKWKGLWARALTEKRSFYTNEAPPVPRGHPVIENNLAAPILFGGEAIGLLNLANKDGGYTEADCEILDGIAARLAPVLYAWIQRRLREEERERIEQQQEELYRRERRISEMLQQALIPAHIPTSVSGCQFAAKYIPALDEAAVGGDFYDVFDLGDGKVAVLIGDVVGKGVLAAMQVSAARYSFRSYAYTAVGPSEVVGLVNNALCRSQDTTLSNMLTAFFAIVDTRDHTVAYTNAGHEPPVVRRTDGSLEELNVGARALGVMPDCDYPEAKLALKPGDLIVMVTDGITEARSAEHGMFGKDGMLELLAEAEGSLSDLVDRLLEKARHHGNGSLQDDVAMVALGLEPSCIEVGCNG